MLVKTILKANSIPPLEPGVGKNTTIVTAKLVPQITKKISAAVTGTRRARRIKNVVE
jgi:hypothetical protein